MSDRTGPINDVLKVIKAGAEFYDDAAEKVDNPDLAALFREIASIRRDAVSDLTVEVAVTGEAPADAGWVENALTWYGEMRGEVGGDADWVAQLEEHEDRTLSAIRSAMSEASGTPEHDALERHLVTFRATHDRMKALKMRLAA